MTVFTTACCTNTERPARAPWLAILLLWMAALFAPLPALADGIVVRSAELTPLDESWALDADLDISLSLTLEEALNKGLPLYFNVEFELVRPRSFWFGETLALKQQQIRLSYHALTQQYQLSSGILHKSFESLDDARHALSRLRQWKVAERSVIRKGQSYRAGVRMSLDTSRLPKPIQVSALAAKEWNLSGDWHYWNIQP